MMDFHTVVEIMGGIDNGMTKIEILRIIDSSVDSLRAIQNRYLLNSVTLGANLLLYLDGLDILFYYSKN